VHRAEARVAEAVRLGFTNIIMPKANLQRLKAGKLLTGDADIVGVSTLAEALDYLVG
jgi:predicted ATP-dependent serine protease